MRWRDRYTTRRSTNAYSEKIRWFRRLYCCCLLLSFISHCLKYILPKQEANSDCELHLCSYTCRCIVSTVFNQKTCRVAQIRSYGSEKIIALIHWGRSNIDRLLHYCCKILALLNITALSRTYTSVHAEILSCGKLLRGVHFKRFECKHIGANRGYRRNER